MDASSSAALSRDIQALFEDGTAVGLTDRQLLDRFAGRPDPSAEAAFEALVRRHGPMVLRVCRNALSDPNDAQDAFQATFLVLVRRCGALRGLDSLGGWLYGVACRVSARARVESARRRSIEGRAALRVVEAVEPAVADEMDRDEFGPIVQEEVRQLPERYRAVVVLCYWEGLTHEQAAAQLGCPLGTVRSRLARARELLRRRLTRRGLAPLAIGIDAATGTIRSLPPPAPGLVQSTVQAAVRIAAGSLANQGVSGAVVSLVHGILWRTTMTKLGGIAAGVILVGVVSYGAGLAAQRIGDAGTPRRASADGRKPVADPGRADPSSREPPGPGDDAARPKAGGRASTPLLIHANVGGETTIVKLVPSGANVKKGDVICELDSAPFQDQLVNQRIAVKAVEAAYLNAKLTREVAELAFRKYREGDYVAQVMDVEGDIKLAEAELALAEVQLNAVRIQGSRPAVQRAELAVLRAKFALEKAQSRKNLLLKYTSEKKIKELETAVKKAHADELARQATWELEIAREKKLEEQIAACTITAPIDGTLGYDRLPLPDGRSVMVSEGIAVRRGQILFAIEPTGQSASPKDKSPASGR